MNASVGVAVLAACLGLAPLAGHAQQSGAATASKPEMIKPEMVKPGDAKADEAKAEGEKKYVPGEVAGMFLLTLLGGPPEALNALSNIEKRWETGFEPMAYETMMLMRDPLIREQLMTLLQRRTGQEFGPDLRAWLRWAWDNEIPMHPDYPNFKKTFYSLVDKKFLGYFGLDRPMTIQLNEVVWGGVAQDGIPPLRDPDMVTAAEADYLADTDVVYGVFINGDARAYPHRILAWHEMFVDTIGGARIAGVYCTLCGTVIAYHTEVDGVTHEMGTSGFLYRSNKLMYDKATQSLWSTMRGEPVIGPLVGQNIRLRRDAVVTSTWGEWRRRHPETKVLSVETGHKRDYSEGAAYRAYFATDELMFPVPKPDTRLANKADVLGVLLDDEQAEPLALSAEFLAANPVHHDATGGTSFVILTDGSGANRVYASADGQFKSYDGDVTVTDADGANWTLSEAALTSPDGKELKRLPAHRAFWFGWHAAFPDTRLVQ